MAEQRRFVNGPLCEWLARLFEKAAQARPEVDLEAVAKSNGIDVESFANTLEGVLERAASSNSQEGTDDMTRIAMAHTVCLEEIGRWERTLQTCAPGSVQIAVGAE